MINDYSLMEISKIHENFLLNSFEQHQHRHITDFYIKTNKKAASTPLVARKKKFSECITKINEKFRNDSCTSLPAEINNNMNDLNTVDCRFDLESKMANGESLLNCCEEQINENEEYKRLNMRRALSVKAASDTKPADDDNNVDTPKTAHEKKVVRFADALGLDLVSIKLIFNPDSPPCIPRKVFDDLRKNGNGKASSEETTMTNTMTSNSSTTITKQKFKYYNEDFDYDVYDDEEDEYISTKSKSQDVVDNVFNSRQKSKTQCGSGQDTDLFQINNLKFKWHKQFEQPGILPDFYLKLNEKKLSLESVYLKSNVLTGIIRVLNISFNKKVNLRYTLDNWQSTKDLNATYIENSCDGLTDRFNFNINLDMDNVKKILSSNNNDMVSTNSLRIDNSLFKRLFTLEFAVCYEADSGSFWDNNNGLNFKVDLLNFIDNSNEQPLTPPSSPPPRVNTTTSNLVKDEIFNLIDNMSAAFV